MFLVMEVSPGDYSRKDGESYQEEMTELREKPIQR